MESVNRSLYEAFSTDERTLPLRKLRTIQETRFDESLRVIHKLANGDTFLSFQSILEAKNALLLAFQVKYAIKIACDEIYGHEEVLAKIQASMNDKLINAVNYMSEVNKWLVIIEGTDAATFQSSNLTKAKIIK